MCPADAAVLNPVEPNDLLLLSEAAAEGRMPRGRNSDADAEGSIKVLPQVRIVVE